MIALTALTAFHAWQIGVVCGMVFGISGWELGRWLARKSREW